MNYCTFKMLETKRIELEIALRNNNITISMFLSHFMPLGKHEKVLLFSLQSDLTSITKGEAIQNIELLHELRKILTTIYTEYIIELIPRYNNQTLKDIYLKLK